MGRGGVKYLIHNIIFFNYKTITFFQSILLYKTYVPKCTKVPDFKIITV